MRSLRRAVDALIAAAAAAAAAAAGALLLGGCAHRSEPLAAGRYCLVEPLVADTGRETFALGDFWMVVDVDESGGRRRVSFANKMPDNPEILMADPAPATQSPDGSLARVRGKLRLAGRAPNDRAGRKRSSTRRRPGFAEPA